MAWNFKESIRKEGRILTFPINGQRNYYKYKKGQRLSIWAMFSFYQMSFAFAHQSNTNKAGDSKTSTPARHTSNHDHQITNLNKDSHHYVFHLQRAIGNQAIQRVMRSSNAGGFHFAKIGIFQPKLKVSQPGDAYEREADEVADQVIGMMMSPGNSASTSTEPVGDEQMIDRKCSECDMNENDKKMALDISRQSSFSFTTNNRGDTRERDDEINAIQSVNGSSLDGSTKEFTKSRFGYDFSNVRIHSDERAARSARSVDALAYTVGNDIVFGEGQYMPSTMEGRKLLAHELAHVVQQSKIGYTSPIIRRKVTTLGGEWDHTKYDILDDPSSVGVDIELNFTPGPLVDAKKIGLIQMVRSISGRTPSGGVRLRHITDAQGRTTEPREIPPTKQVLIDGKEVKVDDPAAGFHIDVAEMYSSEGEIIKELQRRSPIYFAGASKRIYINPDTLATTEEFEEEKKDPKTGEPVIDPKTGKPVMEKSRGEYGQRYKDEAGKLHTKPAILKDNPHSDRILESSQIFETAALAVEGKQESTVYGSVQWGWKLDKAGNFSKLPLTLVNMGIPSETFRRSLEIWNISKTPAEHEVLKIPLMKALMPAEDTEVKAIYSLIEPAVPGHVYDYPLVYQILNNQSVHKMLRTLSALNKMVSGLLLSLYTNLDKAYNVNVRRLEAAIEAVRHKDDSAPLSLKFMKLKDEYSRSPLAGKLIDGVPADDIGEILTFTGLHDKK